MRLLAVFLFLIISLSITAQKDPILSKFGAYRTNFTLKDSSVVSSLNRLAGDSCFSNPDRSQVFSRRALEIAKQIEFEEGQCSSYLVIASAKVYSNQFDSAYHYALTAKQLADRIKSAHWQIKSLEMIGNIHSYKEEYKEAIDYLIKATDVAERKKPELLSVIYSNIAYVFHKTDNSSKTEEYCKKAIKLGFKYKDTGALMSSYNLLGLNSKQTDHEKALDYFQLGLELANKKGHVKRQSEILYNMSNIYFNLGETDKGFELFNKSIEISKHKGSNLSIAISYHAMSMNYFEVDKKALALQYADSALEYALQSGNYEVIMESYALMANIYADREDYLNGMINLNEAYNYKDSLNLAEINSVVTDAEAKYESEKKDLKFKLERERDQKIASEKIRSREVLLWLAGLALILFLLAAIVLRRQNQKIKAKSAEVASQKEEIEQQHVEITESIRYAERIQNSLLPPLSSLSELSKKVTLFFKPKDVVSGDFYWSFKDEKSGRYFFAVADCTGHGVPGSMVSMLAISSLNEVIRTSPHKSSGELLNLLRERITDNLIKGDQASNDGLDICFCIYDPKDHKLEFSGANNNLWLIRQKTEHEVYQAVEESEDLVLIEINGDRMPIGNYFKIPPPFTTHTIDLKSHDQLILYTDGFADQFGGDLNKKYKYARLKRFLLGQINANTLKESTLAMEFNEWKGQNEQTDDVCIMVIEF